jgi:hypothetical protein
MMGSEATLSIRLIGVNSGELAQVKTTFSNDFAAYKATWTDPSSLLEIQNSFESNDSALQS